MKNIRFLPNLLRGGLRFLITFLPSFMIEKNKNESFRFDFKINFGIYFELPSLSIVVEKINQIAMDICDRLGRTESQDLVKAQTAILLILVGLLFWALNNIIIIFKMVF